MTLVPWGSGKPDLSVLLVTHGAWELTQRALDALESHTPRPFELIAVDNASQDETVARLSGLAGARVVVNRENRGYGPAVNQAASDAHADRLLLLNTDAFVHPGWLEPLLEALDHGSIGAAVPCYLHPDGSLQEAGVLLAQDGTVAIYGDGGDANEAWYRFRRIVDFGSAACMLIRRDVYTSVGGFDEAYAPAYYEDVDLCLRIAERGLAVVYEPRSTVTHLRYGSANGDAADDLSDRNRGMFVERWASRLDGRPWTLDGASRQSLIWARDALASPRALVCTRGDDPRGQEAARMLLEHWRMARVTWATGTPFEDAQEASRWRELGIEVIDDRDPSWLAHRLFHYDIVLLGAEPEAQLVTEVQRSQPQAPQISLSHLDAPSGALLSRAIPVFARAGISPPPQGQRPAK